MRKFLYVWRSIRASSFVLSVIESGYKLPFVSIPVKFFFSNHKSAVDNRAFVCEAIEQLLLAGSAVEVKRDQVHVCSPLGVVPKKNGKLRLILDLRFLNKHLAKRKFKFEDLRVVAEILQPDDWFFTFDLRNGYHHVDIFQEHWKYLAFSFTFDGKPRYFLFCSLPFGLSTSPYVFTKLLRPVVAHWRSQGIRISVYLDDGIGADSSKDSCSQDAQLVRGDLDRLGLLVNEEKSNFEPRQKGEHLGFILDLTKGEFSIPPGKIDHLFNLISLLLDDVSPTARDVSRITGTLISMELALGPVVSLRTRALYAVLNSVHNLSCKVALTREAVEELNFWRDNFSRLCGKPIWRPSPKIELLSYSNASNVGWAGFIVQIFLSKRFVQLDLFLSHFPVFWRVRSASIDLTIRASAVFCPSAVVSLICKKKRLPFTICAMKQVFAFLRSGYLATLISKLIIGRKLSTPMIGCSTLSIFASWIFCGDPTP